MKQFTVGQLVTATFKPGTFRVAKVTELEVATIAGRMRETVIDLADADSGKYAGSCSPVRLEAVNFEG